MGGAFPSRYVGLKDTLQIYSWLEERYDGIHGIVAIDLRDAANDGNVHDVGCIFGVGPRETLEWFSLGGPGKLAPLGVVNEDYSE
jgi:hypothetical protein